VILNTNKMKNYTIGDTVTVEWLGKCYKSTIIAHTEVGYKVLLEDGTIIPRVGLGDAQWANIVGPAELPKTD